MLQSLSTISNPNYTNSANFKGASVFPPELYHPQLIRTIQNDSIHLSSKNQSKNAKNKKKLSPFAKAAIGVSALGVALIGTALLISRGRTNYIKKLYNEKLILSNLAEKINFTEAKTLDEAIKFSKDVLKIKNVDSGFSLDALNFINKGLVDISNANKGKLFMPTALRYVDDADGVIAGVIQNVQSSNFGEMQINKKYFSMDVLDDLLGLKVKQNVTKSTTQTAPTVTKAKKISDYLYGECVASDDKISAIVKKFQNNPGALTLAEKRDLYFAKNAAGSKMLALFDSPSRLLNKSGIVDILSQNGITVKPEEILKLPIEQQRIKLLTILEEYFNKNGKKLTVHVPLESNIPIQSIYHEMGHLQDFAKNLKELDVKMNSLSIGEIFKDAFAGKKSRVAVDEINNRWGGLTYNGFKELFSKNPTKFQETFPELYEFLTDAKIQETAGKVSHYSMSSIGEFIAETYKKLVSGIKLPDEVMNLYEKYNGPLLI